MHIRVQAQEQQAQQPQQRPAPAQMPQQAPSPALQPPQMPPVHETHLDPDSGINEMDPDDTTPPPGPELHQAEDDWSNTPRNSACPCGSGKKYKHCHGALSPQRA
jgi:preprotein translocase subunit SecA